MNIYSCGHKTRQHLLCEIWVHVAFEYIWQAEAHQGWSSSLAIGSPGHALTRGSQQTLS